MLPDNPNYDERTKTRYIRRKNQIIDQETGEIFVAAEPVEIQYGHTFYSKIDEKLLFFMSEKLAKASIRIFCYLAWRMSAQTNTYRRSAKELAKELNVGIGTIEKVLQELRSADLIRSAGRCNWMINPRVALKVAENRRSYLIETFTQLSNPTKDRELEERIKTTIISLPEGDDEDADR